MTSVQSSMTISKHASVSWDEIIPKLLDSKEMYDVIFIVGTEVFPAHRMIVSAISPAFNNLLKGVPKRGTVSIPHVDPDDFGVILSHVYGKEVTIHSLQHSWNLLPVAKNYGLGKLAKKCKKYIIDCIDIKNACGIFEEAQYQEEGDITLECYRFMTKNAKYLFRGKGLIGAHPNTVATIIKQDCINVDSEYELFSAVLEWAKMECTLSKYSKESNALRKVVEPLLPYIRVLRLSYCEFMKERAIYDILTKEEILNTSLKLLTPGSHELLPIWCNSVKERRNLKSEFAEKKWRMPCPCIAGKDKSCREATLTLRPKMEVLISGIGFKLSLKHSVFVDWISVVVSVKTEEGEEKTVFEKQEIVTISEQIAKFRNLVYVKRGGWFEVSIKVDDLSPDVHCCKITPSMDNSPFSIVPKEGEEKHDSCFCVVCYLSLT